MVSIVVSPTHISPNNLFLFIFAVFVSPFCVWLSFVCVLGGIFDKMCALAFCATCDWFLFPFLPHLKCIPSRMLAWPIGQLPYLFAFKHVAIFTIEARPMPTAFLVLEIRATIE